MSRFIPRVTCRPCAVTFLAVAGALATAASLGAPAAGAQPAADTPQVRVYYSFRDLSTDRGVHALYRRITSAARAVCPRYDSQDLQAFAYSRQCQRQAIARAIRQINDPRLAAVYARSLLRHG